MKMKKNITHKSRFFLLLGENNISTNCLIYHFLTKNFFMKKKTEKKLALGKIKIASLSKKEQQVVNGGRINLTRTICGVCPPPISSDCTTHHIIC